MNETYPKKKETMLASAKSKERLGRVDKQKAMSNMSLGEYMHNSTSHQLAARLCLLSIKAPRPPASLEHYAHLSRCGMLSTITYDNCPMFPPEQAFLLVG